MGNFWKGVGDFFTGGGDGFNFKNLMGGIGAFGNLYSTMKDPGMNTEMYNQLNTTLQPMQDQIAELEKYKDPNSAFNQQMRDQVRTSNMDYMYDMAARDRAASLGTGYEGLGNLQDSTMTTNAVAQGLTDMSNRQLQQTMQTQQQQGQLRNAYSQAQNQNMMYAQQAARQRQNQMGNQFSGLMKWAMG